MPQIGLRYPVYAPLTEDETNGTATYANGKIAGKAVKVDMSINYAESKHYADDNVDEAIKEFVDGKITFTADDLENSVKKDWLGNTVETVTINTEQVEVLVSKDVDNPGYFGFGFIVPKIKNKVRSYRTIIYTKVKYSEPNESAETKGQQINFHSPTIEGMILRRVDGVWKREITTTSLVTAKAWLAQELKIAIV